MKSKMKKIARILSIAALVAMGIMGAACSKIESREIETPETPETQKENIVTLTTTVGFAADGTKALTGTGVKTFAEGETMAVIYNNGTSTVKAVSHALEESDITDSGKKATFTFDLATPNKSVEVTYIYPAAMANDDGTVNYSALNSQNGTLVTLGSNLDYCTKSGTWDGDNLPTLTLENQLAILAITLKNEDGSSEITSGTTKLTLSDGTNTYNVNRSVAEGPIYVAIRPTTSANISIEAISSSQGYYKNLTTKTYAANNGYSVSWKMTPATLLSTITSDYTAQDGETLYGKLGSNVKISIADGAKVTLKDVNINGSGTWTSGDYAGITCEGDATITLKGTNTLKGFYDEYPGIYVPESKTLTIEGEGSLKATSNGDAPGIGAGANKSCGNIVINGGNITATGNGNHASGIGGGENAHAGNITITGGTVTATGDTRAAGIGGGGSADVGNITITGGTVTATGGYRSAGIGGSMDRGFGDILISGGTVTAKGGEDAAGIGGGRYNGRYGSYCGTITIKSTVTKVTATKGSSSAQSIGAGNKGNGISVTIEAGANVTQN